ncbi:MAG: DUF2249 domain-containing protein [Sphingobacteriia bacterium]|nr:DUF2249 domain-containing protein [Sphingobacteriia bacterium]
MTINANTKIAVLLKQHPGALEAIVHISPKFNKLRNPILRKVIAGRTSISMASKLGGCSPEDFFNALEPLGFEVDRTVAAHNEIIDEAMPQYLQQAAPEQMRELDVRDIIESGKDPLNNILESVNNLQPGEVLNIINSFEPTPLRQLLGKRGFESYASMKEPGLVYTYFYKKEKQDTVHAATPPFLQSVADTTGRNAAPADWEQMLNRFQDRLNTIDVRELSMPQPMHAILEALETLPPQKALLVHHKRIPVFLLPELEERKLSYRIKEMDADRVELLIYRD